jgi:hypothetical protein
MSDKPTADGVFLRNTPEEDDDVEGHSMLPTDPSMARHLANAREHEIREHLKRHDLEAEARRPHKR